MKRYLPLIIFIGLIIFLYLALGKDSKKLPSPLIGKPFPNITLSDLNTQQSINSVSALQKQITLVNVWASWCVTCLAEHQTLLELSKQENIRLIGINYKDSRQNAMTFLKKYGNPFAQNIFDPAGRLGLELGVYATPETFLVNKKGVIIYKHIGELTQKIILKIISLTNLESTS